MIRLQTILFLLLSMFGNSASSQTPLAFDKREATRFIDQYLQRNAVAGVIAVVTNGDEVILDTGFGHDLEGHWISAETRVPLASLSKSMTATAVMQLVDQGSVELDAPVAKYLPEFQLEDSRSKSITVRQILSHTSGMSDRTFREKSVSPVPTDLKEAVASLRLARLATQPGEARSYHNPNYWVAARLVEVVSREPFSVYMRDHIFLPAHMENTYEVNSLKEARDVAPGSVRVLNESFERVEPDWFLGGCCGVISTAHDLAQWLIVQNGGSQALTTEASLHLMHNGLGWNRTDTDGGTLYSHNGVMFTHSAQQYLLPQQGQGMGIVVVANSGLSLAPLPAEELAEGLRNIAKGEKDRPGVPVGPLVDSTLLFLMVATLGLVYWRSRRNIRDGRMGAGIRAAVATGLVSLAAMFPSALRFISRRDANWEQCLSVAPLLFGWVVISALSMCALSLYRLSRLRTRAKQPKSQYR